jgi:uncharacterized membrane protein YphA (DoxX/SURF4 family)
VAAVLLINAANFSGPSLNLLVAGASLISISLSVGFLTPFLAVIACAFAAATLLIGPHSGNPLYVFAILDAGALALLGPGAYSVDAKLFGRRVTVVRPRKDKAGP